MKTRLVETLRSDLLPIERHHAGINLAILGDPRREVTEIDHIQFCYVPKSKFYMGEGNDEYLNDKLNYAYWIARYPVSVAQFKSYVKQEKPKQRDWDWEQGYTNHPVVSVNWYEALAFCEWLIKHWRQKGRLPDKWRVSLPSEAEWEKVARGGVEIPSPDKVIIKEIGKVTFDENTTMQKNELLKRRFPWGDEVYPDNANYSETGIGTSSSVGCFPKGRSPYGCEEMSGNVWEWTRSLWGKKYDKTEYKYPYDPKDGREDLKMNGMRVLRGGSFGD